MRKMRIQMTNKEQTNKKNHKKRHLNAEKDPEYILECRISTDTTAPIAIISSANKGPCDPGAASNFLQPPLRVSCH